MGSNINSNIILPFHGLEEAGRIHKLIGEVTVPIIFRVFDFTSNLMFNADALIVLLFALFRKHGLAHIHGEVIDRDVEVHDGVQFLLGGDQVE